MKTRTLLLLSVGCGLLILLAGGFKLLQVANDRTEVPVLDFGTSARIGDMTVAVMSVSDGSDGTRVVVRMVGVPGEPVVNDWRLLGDGKVFEPSGAEGAAEGSMDAQDAEMPVCGRSSVVPADGDSIECVIRFPSVGAIQAIAYTRAGEQRQWAPPTEPTEWSAP